MNDNYLKKSLDGLFKIISLDITDSTNNEAKRIIASGETEPFMVIAREQTSGRGRQGKSFFSPFLFPKRIIILFSFEFYRIHQV